LTRGPRSRPAAWRKTAVSRATVLSALRCRCTGTGRRPASNRAVRPHRGGCEAPPWTFLLEVIFSSSLAAEITLQACWWKDARAAALRSGPAPGVGAGPLPIGPCGLIGAAVRRHPGTKLISMNYLSLGAKLCALHAGSPGLASRHPLPCGSACLAVGTERAFKVFAAL
jgi:hypothetical protein